MKKSFLIASFAIITLVACNSKNTSDNPSMEPINSSSSINQDSIDKAHGHSHDPSGNDVPVINQDSIDKAHGHSHDAPSDNQQNTDKPHGHTH